MKEKMRKAGVLWLVAAIALCLCLPALAAPEEAEAETETPAAEETQTEAPETQELPQETLNQVDLTYSGPLDGPTGLPATAVSSERQAGEPIMLGDGSYGYIPESNRFVAWAGERRFTCTVPMGIILQKGETVAFQLPEGVTGTLYKDGSPVESADLTEIRETGSYILQVKGSGLYDSASYPFTILGELTGSLSEYTLPEGFVFDEVTLNGETLTTEYLDSLQLLEDGEFRISYSCAEISKHYSATFTLDREPPVLALPEVTDGQARSAVTLEDLEPGAWIQGERDGTSFRVTSSMTVLKEPGEYTLTVYDQAGNSTQYDFIIQVYLNISAVTAIALLAAGVLGIVFYCRWVRKHARVG